jgi:enterochelin esterase-like enzyme
LSNERTRSLTRRAFLLGAGAAAATAILSACSVGASPTDVPAAGAGPTGTAAPPTAVVEQAGDSATPLVPAATAVPAAAVIQNSQPAAPAPAEQHASAIPSASQLLNGAFTSVALGRNMPYFVYLPVGYAESGKRYPVLYMLHGHGGENTEWIGYGLPETADHLMNAGQIGQMIIVLPQGDQSFWVNHADDGQRWGDYTAQDVVQYIDATYRTIPDAKHRAIGGLSMGADGAMQLAMNYPGTYSAVGIHSPTLRNYADTTSYVPFFGDEAYFDAHDPVVLTKQYPDRAHALHIFLDVGADDAAWIPSVRDYHDLLTQLDVVHTWHDEWPGIHDGYYWGGHATDYLHFYAAAITDT